MAEQVSLRAFYEMLEVHDWTYMMSDDHSVYTRGRAAESKLREIARQSPEHQALFDGFHKFIWSGDHMGTEKAELPEKPA